MNEGMNGCSHTKNEFDKRKQECLVQKFGLRRFQTLDAIQEEPRFQLPREQDKRRLRSQGEIDWDQG